MVLGDKFRNLVSSVQTVAARVGEEREVRLPEGLINAAIDRLVVKGDLRSLVLHFSEERLQLDVVLLKSGSRIHVSGQFALAGIDMNQHHQKMSLRQMEPLAVAVSPSGSSAQRLLLRLLSPWLGVLAGMAFRRALRGIEGTFIESGGGAGRLFHFDLSPHIARDSLLMTTISTLNVTGARFEPAELVLRGNINVLGMFA